jgi:hypothetical protein
MASVLTRGLSGANLSPRRLLVVAFSVLLASLTLSVGARPRGHHAESVQTTSAVVRPVRSPLCRRGYRAEVRLFNFEPSISLDDFVKDLNERYQANIILDNELKNLQVSLSRVTAPWTSILRIALAQNRLGLVCMEGGASSASPGGACWCLCGGRRAEPATVKRAGVSKLG